MQQLVGMLRVLEEFVNWFGCAQWEHRLTVTEREASRLSFKRSARGLLYSRTQSIHRGFSPSGRRRSR